MKDIMVKALINYGWIVFIALFYFLWRYKENKIKDTKDKALLTSLRETLYMLMLQAEKAAKDKDIDGFMKFEWVLREFKKLLPMVPETVYLFTNDADIAKYVQDTYYKFKDFLDNGTIDKSIVYPAKKDDEQKKQINYMWDEPAEECTITKEEDN